MKGSFIKEFKTFILRGNVLDMAVGVIIGGAFGKIVSSLVSDVLMPIVSLLTGRSDFSDMVWVLRPATENSQAVTVNGGAFIQSVIDFLVIALCVFVILRIAVRIRKKAEAMLKKEKEETASKPAPPTPEQESAAALKEIRDILAEMKGAGKQ